MLEIRLTERGDRRSADWKQIEGILPFNEGAWIVERVNDRSILRYQVAASLHWVPQFLVNSALRPRLDRLLRAVEQRTRDLEQREPDYFRDSSAQTPVLKTE